MKLDNFTAWTQAVLSAIYLVCTFTIIIIYELGLSKLTTQGQEKTFDSMVNWMTGGALIVLYFWLQRAKAQTTPDPETTTVNQTTVLKTTPSVPTPPIPPVEPTGTPIATTGTAPPKGE